jgi:hypothetical protein
MMEREDAADHIDPIWDHFCEFAHITLQQMHPAIQPAVGQLIPPSTDHTIGEVDPSDLDIGSVCCQVH